ncbi:hypothetical protein [Stenotrophomonas sp.]|uniref:hypothetical protein n=1 Tax=Stenotrophomonas sp. TaxID=69392 RepID=UPI00289CA072|nr:hypothetical protein [Stenotrophomonas sp.]
MKTAMNMAVGNTARSGGRIKPRFAALAVGLALAFGAGAPTTAVAGGVPVFDGAGWFETMMGRLQTMYEYVKDNTRWLAVLKQISDAMIEAYGIFKSFGLPPGAILTPVPEDYLVAESCGTGNGLSVDTLFSLFNFKPEGDWKVQQRQICVNIRMMQNRKYNDSVKFINDTIPSMDQLMTAINNLRKLGNLRGNVDAVNSDSLRTANELAVQAQSWQARMKAYDAYIEVMEANQRVVAEAALKGEPGGKKFVSELVKTAALKAALSVK